MGAKIDDHITGTRGPYTFHIHGEVYHRIGSFFPQSTVESSSFAQIYIFDTDNETQNRLNIMPSLNQVILAAFQNMLYDINPYVQVFQQTGRLFQQNPSQNLTMIITDSRMTDS